MCTHFIDTFMQRDIFTEAISANYFAQGQYNGPSMNKTEHSGLQTQLLNHTTSASKKLIFNRIRGKNYRQAPSILINMVTYPSIPESHK